MNEDIYAPPQSDPETDIPNKALELASRGSRLGASLLDSLIMMVIVIPAMYFTGAFDDLTNPSPEPTLLYDLAIGLLGLVVFLAINFKLLADSGQTIGKKIVGIQIVNNNGEAATWGKNLFKRYAVYFLPGQVPFIGQIFSLVNVLFIFGKDQKCIHDIAADTKVIRK